MPELQFGLPETGHDSAFNEIRRKLRALERRDWWLWVTAVTVLLLITSALFVLEVPVLLRSDDLFSSGMLDIAVRGLLGLVLLFSVFAVYQQHVIKRWRTRMAAQIGMMAALQTRAEVFEKLAILDPLTGLFNRRFANEHLPMELARAERMGCPFTLLLLDLNSLKQINDSQGHAAGDLVLREFAHELKKCVRSSDLPVRLGGDEFMVLLPECRAYSVPVALARLRNLQVQVQGQMLPVSFGAGWAEYEPGDTPERLIERADQALYEDKKTGRASRQVEQAEANEQHGQKMQVVGEMTGRVVHDFNNLLTVIKGYAELVLGSMTEQDANRSKIDDIRKAADHAAQLTSQLLAFTRRQGPRTRVVDLNQQVQETASLIRPLLGGRVKFVTAPGEGLGKVRVQAGHIEQILLNLATNARDAITGEGTITVETGNALLDEAFVVRHPGSRVGRHVRLSVADNGCGMDPGVLAHVFEPYFTTKPSGKGTGLGLSTVYGIVKQAGGYVMAESEPGKGSRFSIYLPRYEEPAAEEDAALAAHAPALELPLRGRGQTILVVESVDALRALTCEFLKSEGFRFLEATSAAQALQLANDYPGKIDLVVTDVVLPGMSCLEMSEALAARRPDIKILYIAGYHDASVGQADFLRGGAFLETPFSPTDLRGKIGELLRASTRKPETGRAAGVQ